MAVCLRVFIGLVLLVSGFEKLISPYQNFLYVLQSYELFPAGLEKPIALIVPWVELLVGIFMVLGLWLNWALAGSLALFGCFIMIVGQALFRHLSLDQCGCFGENIHIAPHYIIIFDSIMFLILLWLIRHPAKVKTLSLDQYLK